VNVARLDKAKFFCLVLEERSSGEENLSVDDVVFQSHLFDI
jgi:hypothetical protein